MPDMPDTWLNLTKLPGLLRFTHTQYDQPGCEAELRRYWPGFQEIAVRPLPLRAIFIALARSRKANGGLTCN